MPQLGFGTFKISGARCVTAVECALEVGYRHVDTAQMYHNEAEVGLAIRNSSVDREAIFLATKVWRDRLSAGSLGPSVEESLRRLQTDYVDLLLVHWPGVGVPIEETLETMMALHNTGKVKLLGVSNFPPSLLKRALLCCPLSNIQVEYHPYLGQDELLDIARAHDMTLTAYAPLAQGRVFDDRVLRAIGDRHGKSAGQVVLRWLIQQESVAAIPKSSDLEHIRSNFDIRDFTLSDEEMNEIFALDCGRRLVNPSFAPNWERTDESEWLRGYRVPRPIAPVVRTGRSVVKKVRVIVRRFRLR